MATTLRFSHLRSLPKRNLHLYYVLEHSELGSLNSGLPVAQASYDPTSRECGQWVRDLRFGQISGSEIITENKIYKKSSQAYGFCPLHQRLASSTITATENTQMKAIKYGIQLILTLMQLFHLLEAGIVFQTTGKYQKGNIRQLAAKGPFMEGLRQTPLPQLKGIVPNA